VSQKLNKLLTERKERQGRLVSVRGSLGEVEVKARCDEGGVLSLAGVSVAGFRLVRVPRVWDDPDRREAEKGAAGACPPRSTVQERRDEWTAGVTELARWIRYVPPPPGAKGIEPWVEDLEEEEGGPESITDFGWSVCPYCFTTQPRRNMSCC